MGDFLTHIARHAAMAWMEHLKHKNNPSSREPSWDRKASFDLENVHKCPRDFIEVSCGDVYRLWEVITADEVPGKVIVVGVIDSKARSKGLDECMASLGSSKNYEYWVNYNPNKNNYTLKLTSGWSNAFQGTLDWLQMLVSCVVARTFEDSYLKQYTFDKNGTFNVEYWQGSKSGQQHFAKLDHTFQSREFNKMELSHSLDDGWSSLFAHDCNVYGVIHPSSYEKALRENAIKVRITSTKHMEDLRKMFSGK